MSSLKTIAVGLVLLAAQVSASAADLAILRNGSSIPYLRKEQNGSVTRLFISGGYMDIPTADIASFDRDDSTPPLPSADANEQAPQPAAQPAAPATLAAAPAQPVDIDQVVREASGRHKLDPDFVASVIKAESNFKPHAVSRKGAQGLMQLMPATAAKLGVTNAFDPRANVEAGTAHLSALLDQYNNDPIKALAAYNAGAHRVQQYHGVPPYRETRLYVAKIVRDFNSKKLAQMKAGKTSATTASKSRNAQPATTPAAKSVPAKTKPAQPQHASVPKANKPA